jgi:hypothetical protein
MIGNNWTAPDLQEQRGRYRTRQCIGNLAVAEEFEEYSSVSSGWIWGDAKIFGLDQGPQLMVMPSTASTSVAPIQVFGEANHNVEAGTSPVVAIASIVKRKINDGINRLLIIAEDENFQDGVESNLSLGLAALVTRFPNETLNAIKGVLVSRKVSLSVHTEILGLMGRIENDATKDERLSILVLNLMDKSPLVRDGAAIGLAYLNDRRAVAHLQKAVGTESIATLREDLQSVIEQLEQ